ncbi:hypothetical protein Aple_013000 [Acrocarpospora pleiomorpha]|uniref:Uncharacterized protein n=1 Tax=Acrocarpospora pleiomorpha TaxID=90975 RepID=A0A5M3X9J5_9ACTN|nr:hypothetical protein [Acrocarpospora pleiomorpha]GES18405.1 hypothetical protein Aple_013000 [Acrocarpospora pleiomorpha]
MFRASTVQDVEVSGESGYVNALLAKLLDIDHHRIAANDSLVLRKAVLGLLEIVAELERRLIALEGPDVRTEWTTRLEEHLAAAQPVYATTDDKQTAQ